MVPHGVSTTMSGAKTTYPEITKAQWAVLEAMTDQRCANLLEAADFISDLSPEAKAFLKSADKKKIQSLNENIEFYSTSKAVWKFLWIGGGAIMALLAAWKTLGDYISVKIK
jgi:mannose/fructose/N-acetylgalactosamine-specific phosphotransferase system component IID